MTQEKKSTKIPKNLKLASAIDRISDIVSLLSNENVDLNESVVLYEEASILLSWCDEQVASAKMKIEQINTEKNKT